MAAVGWPEDEPAATRKCLHFADHYSHGRRKCHLNPSISITTDLRLCSRRRDTVRSLAIASAFLTPIRCVLLQADFRAGQSTFGRAFECCCLLYDHCMSSLVDQHRKYGRLQQLNLVDQWHTHGVLWHVHRLLYLAQTVETTDASVAVPAWPIWPHGQSTGNGLFVGSLCNGEWDESDV